jgi:hypothetical protein
MITMLCVVACVATIILLFPPFLWAIAWLATRSVNFWFRILPDIYTEKDARRGAR